MFIKIILLSFCGGLFCLDRIFIQAMVSRPIVVAPVMGMILNDPYSGLIIGAMLELFWIDRLPVGTYIPPHDSIAAVLATSIAVFLGQNQGGTSPEMIALAILMALPFGVIAKRIDILIIESNDVISEEALKNAEEANIKAIERKNYWGLVKYFFITVLYLFVLQAILVPAAIWFYPKLTAPINNMLSLVYYFLPLLGAAVVLNTIKVRGVIPVFCAIFLIVTFALEFFHVF